MERNARSDAFLEKQGVDCLFTANWRVVTFLRRAIALLFLGALAACDSSAKPFIPASGGLSAQPASVDVLGVGATFVKTITVSEDSYTGAFTETDTCSGIATLASSSPAGPSAAFVATGVASGTCVATFADAHGQKTAATIAVSVSNVIINARHEGQ
jgi:hypothetical protein